MPQPACPKCQAGAARRWLEARQNELLPVEYYHVVFTLPAPVAALACYNKAVIYRLLFEVAAQPLCTIAADPMHLGARIGATLVLHTWGSALTHHPHVHGIVPGGGLSQDGERWVACRHGACTHHSPEQSAIKSCATQRAMGRCYQSDTWKKDVDLEKIGCARLPNTECKRWVL